MKYFIDTEFVEGPQTKRFLGIPYGKTKPTIDLISLAIVSEDGREYYAISKDFNLEEAWNRVQWKYENTGAAEVSHPEAYKKKVYWLRDNVLRPIFDELSKRYNEEDEIFHTEFYFNKKDLNFLIEYYGKTNKQIAEEVKGFCERYYFEWPGINGPRGLCPAEFYGYYADYDWVVFCWLWGRMIDLPTGFPMYCRDLKQELDERLKTYTSEDLSKAVYPNCDHNVYEAMDYKTPLITMGKCIKEHPNYPKQTNEHNALADARWNKKLYEFIQTV